MAPRKSTSRSTRLADAGPSKVASSSKSGLGMIPPLDIPDSITSDYIPPVLERVELDEEQRETLIHELIGFHPRALCEDITESVRREPYGVVTSIENWADVKVAGKGAALSRELDIGLHALETLLNSHVDKALDKLTAWILRNAFEIPQGLEPVLPWHRGLDFSRGEHVAALHNGEETLMHRLDALRSNVEQARFVSQQLVAAEAILDRRLEVARQRKAEVGFVKEILEASGLSPLPTTSTQTLASLTSLHSSLTPLAIPAPSIPPAQGNAKAWELGRQAYLNWAVGKMVGAGAERPAGRGDGAATGGGGGGDDRMEGIESGLARVGGMDGVEAILRGVGG